MSEGRTKGWRCVVTVLSAVLGAALLLSAACGGDDDGATKVDGSSNRTTATETTDRDETADATDDEGGDDDAAADLRALAENYEDFTGVVNYKTTGFGDASFTSMKIYKGENASRVDYEGASGTGTVITTSDAIYICGAGVCIKYDTGNLALDPTAAVTALLSAQSIASTFGGIPDGVDVEKSSEEIGGIDATCYEYSGDGNGEICVSESGLLLKLATDAASGGGIFEATEATDEVSDDDFEPPFPVTEFPGFGQ